MCLKAGWIAVGLPMELRVGGRHVVTSPVNAIVTERLGDFFADSLPAPRDGISLVTQD